MNSKAVQSSRGSTSSQGWSVDQSAFVHELENALAVAGLQSLPLAVLKHKLGKKAKSSCSHESLLGTN
jgi:hypothetical protein